MNRLLITLLALLTGLVAQVSPAAATARVGGQTEIGALKERIQVLERIAADHNRAVTLDQDIEKLRDSSKI